MKNTLLLAILMISISMGVMPGENAARRIHAGKEPLLVAAPNFGSDAILVKDGRGYLEWRSALGGSTVNSFVEVEDRELGRREFDALRQALRTADMDIRIEGRPFRLSRPEVVADAIGSIMVRMDAMPLDQHPDGGDRTRPGRRPRRAYACHLHLHGRRVRVIAVFDRENERRLERRVRDWMEDIIKGNRPAADNGGKVRISLPERRWLEIPPPVELSGVEDISEEIQLPSVRFFEKGRGGKNESGRMAIATLMSGQPLSAREFRKMAPAFEAEFLKLPMGRKTGHSDDMGRYSFASPDRSRITFTAICLIDGYLFRFDMGVPNGDELQKSWAELALSIWVAEASLMSAEGPGRVNAGR